MHIACIDKSAFELADAVLGPESNIDRAKIMPVAAFVIICDLGKIMLRGGGLPTIFPTSNELPWAETTEALNDTLTGLMGDYENSLGAAGYTITNLIGLRDIPRRSTNRPEVWLDGGFGLDGRKLAILPFLATVQGRQPYQRPFGMLPEYWAMARLRTTGLPEPWRGVGTTMITLANATWRAEQPGWAIYK